MPHSGGVTSAASGPHVEWLSGLKVTRRWEIVRGAVSVACGRGRQRSSHRSDPCQGSEWTKCVLTCVLEGARLQAIPRCYKKNGPSAQVTVKNLCYTKLNSFLCVFFAQNKKSSKWATWKFESENVIALAQEPSCLADGLWQRFVRLFPGTEVMEYELAGTIKLQNQKRGKPASLSQLAVTSSMRPKSMDFGGRLGWSHICG